ncbi:MAG: hypothetical protein ABIO70_01450 [Pseudomonadota bacterium]
MAPNPAQHPQAGLLMRLHLMGGVGVICFIAVFLVLGHPVGAAAEGFFLGGLVLTFLWLRLRGTGVVPIAAYQIVALLVTIGVLTWSLGGLVPSGAIAIWAIISPLAAMMFLRRRGILLSSLAYVVLLGFTWAIEPRGAWVQPLPAALQLPLTVLNLLGGSALALLTLGYFHAQLHAE